MSGPSPSSVEPSPSSVELVETPIPGLLAVRLPVHEDARGWFKENWQREAMTALGLPDFGPVQHNVAFNSRRGTTRGFHTEPWDKFVSVATGRAFGAWVDMREGPTFGASFQIEIGPTVGVFVPRGVGNAYQTLEDATSYSYLVNEHWQATGSYPALALDDPTIATPWPIPLSDAEVSAKDRATPRLDAVLPMPPRRTLVTGAGGQLGRALALAFPDAHAVTRAELDVSDAGALDAWPWHDYDVVLNAAAYTAVDLAESSGRGAAWSANAAAPAALARLAARHRLTIVHYSTDYVYDGSVDDHREDEAVSPLGVYGQSKAAGDLAVATAPRHYVLRTSWVVGDGPNFVRTMAGLADRGVSPGVVADQWGRLTFTDELARATRHLLESRSPYGTYHVSNGGPVTSWADLARAVFRLRDRDPDDVRAVTAEEYAEGKDLAPRPRHSALDLTRLRTAGFEPEDAATALARYLASAERP